MIQIINTQKSIETKIEKYINEIKNMILYMNGGPGFDEAKEEYNSCINKLQE